MYAIYIYIYIYLYVYVYIYIYYMFIYICVCIYSNFGIYSTTFKRNENTFKIVFYFNL